MKKTLFVLVTWLAFAASALAQVSVTAPWIRATVPQQESTGVFMHLHSKSDKRLVDVRSPIAGAAEIHQMEMHGHTMKMRQVTGIDLPAGKGVNLASGGYHIMLIDLKRQLMADEVVPITIVVEGKDKKRESITLDVPVKPLTFMGALETMTRHH